MNIAVEVIAATGVILIFAGAWIRVELQASRPALVAPAMRIGNPLTLLPDERLGYSIDSLRASEPDLAADHPLSTPQQKVLLGATCAAALLLILVAKFTLIALVLVINALYISALLLRLHLFRVGARKGGQFTITDAAAREYPDSRLPQYTVLVPAFHEQDVFARLVPNLRSLEYPRHLLQVLLLLEADDDETIAAATYAVGDDDDITIVTVPASQPRTKPKALNYGMTLATGELVTIYDAEDRPDPLQLRKAATAFNSAPPELVCLQAKLDFFNPHQNLLTTWFTIDYNLWFNELLPGLASSDAPIPLGGTSNHFRRAALLELGAWDPFNVTEDADLGVRLHRKGYRSGVLDSVTLEEANSDLINWVKQRSRWYKGYAQTLLVHMRHPVQLYREIGFQAFLMMILFIGGTPLLAALNPLFWTTTALWFVSKPTSLQSIFPVVPYFLGMASWVIGNFLVFWSWLIAARDSKRRMVVASLLSPLYWVLMGVAAIKAVIQLVTAPSYWEKTQHGLDIDPSSVAAGAGAAG